MYARLQIWPHPETCRLLRRPTRTALLELIDQAIEIGIASTKAPRKPVSPALGYPLTISDNLELTCLPRLNHCFNIQALLDEGHETRDLGLVVLSCWAVNDLDLHLLSNLLRAITRFDRWLMSDMAMLVRRDKPA